MRLEESEQLVSRLEAIAQAEARRCPSFVGLFDDRHVSSKPRHRR